MNRAAVLLALAALLATTHAARADEESARVRLAKDHVAFTPEAFLHAVVSGKVEHVQLFLEGGIDPASKDPAGETALWLAVEFKELAVLKALLAGGVVPNETNAPIGDYGKTIAFAAVDTGDAAYVRALVEAGADAKKANEYEMTPLAVAAQAGRLEMCEILLKRGADPNAAPAGFPLLFGPIAEDHREVVKLLLGAGAKLGEHKASLLESATTPEMREILEKAE